jgi:Mg-chelatase subunit ChlD
LGSAGRARLTNNSPERQLDHLDRLMFSPNGPRSPRSVRVAAGGALAGVVLASGLLLAAPDSGVNQSRGLPASACRAVITETMAPLPLPECAMAAVTVTVGVMCPPSLPLHVVFVIGNHLAMQDDLDDVKRAARTAVDSLDFATPTLVGLVTISGQARTQLDLTDRKTAVLSAINRIQLDPVNPFVNYYDWVGLAQNMLEEARGAGTSPLEAIVVYSTGCPNGFESYCSRQVASAGRAKGLGMTVLGVCNPSARPFGFPLPSGHCRTLQQMSTSGYYYDLAQASRVAQGLAAVRGQGVGIAAAKVTLLERLAGGFTHTPQSGAPPPAVSGSDLTFELGPTGPNGVVTATYRAEASAPGTWDLRLLDSAVTIVDTLGRSTTAALVPTRSITVTECVPETATPTATDSPTATATEALSPTPSRTPSSTPTPTIAARPAFLPMALARACKRAERRLDVVLAVDASGSMADQVGDARKIDSARAAAGRFLELLDPADRAAVVAFDDDVHWLQPLTGDHAALRAALQAIDLGAGTRIDRALAAAAEHLKSRDARGNSGAVILLTDGRPDEGTGSLALDRAAELRGMDVVLYTIGLGADVDADLLESLAPGRYLAAGEGDALRRAYEQIAGELPCPGGSLWLR